MSNFLPTGGFQWLAEEKFNDISISDLDEESDEGYIFEVDLGKALNYANAFNLFIAVNHFLFSCFLFIQSNHFYYHFHYTFR